MKRNYQVVEHLSISALITLICLSTLLLSTFSDKQSTPAIASYYNFIVPKVRLTNQYDRKYSYRFHPNPRDYMIKETVTNRRHTRDHESGYLKASLVKAKDGLRRLQTKQRLFDQNKVKSNHFDSIRVANTLANNIRLKHRRINYLRLRISRIKASTRRTLLKPLEYRERRIKGHKIVYLHPNYPIWYQPYRPGVELATATNLLAKNNQAMNIIGIARARGHVFYEVASGGYVYGWVARATIKEARSYQIPFHYYSQLKPTKAPDACEAVSLRMALSSKGRDPRISMRKFIERIPRSKDPNKGYTANPYHYGDDASIYPKALAKYGRRYDLHVYAMKDVSERHLIKEIEEGNPVVYEGSYRMENIDSEHVLVLVGYSKGDLEFADPWYQTKTNKPISWVSLKQFARLFHQRGARAVVVK